MSQKFTVTGNIVNVESKTIYYGTVEVEAGKISNIIYIENNEKLNEPYILPGFVDSHVHIESSMLIPSEFAKLAVLHGTVATISDPHEIANVCGMQGVKFMIDNGKQVNFKFNFGAPSCVPATNFETAGAVINSDDVKALLQMPEIKYLSEMMNFPGVLFNDEEVMKKIKYALELGKPIDGHAPGLRGETAKKYIEGNLDYDRPVISTDHECFTEEEAADKLSYGMKILIREGSAAKNFEALINLLHDNEDMIMFCSDDKHPDSLVINHINALCARAVAKGIDVFKVLKAASLNTIKHYKLDVGLLKVNDSADFIIVDNLKQFNVQATYINGNLVAKNGKSFIESVHSTPINQFNCELIKTQDLKVDKKLYPQNEVPVIEALDGQLITNNIPIAVDSLLNVKTNYLESNTAIDVLKIVVVNRYNKAPIAKAFIKNFGLQTGALASSVAHDSHNIVAVGVDDESLANAINLVIKEQGGVAVAFNATEGEVLDLPVAGLMSNKNGYEVAEAYTKIDKLSKEALGSTLQSPFMTLSFMALLVIPAIKLSDKGLFDGGNFKFINEV